MTEAVVEPSDFHDRSLRYLRTVFPWVHPPDQEMLREAAKRLRVFINLPLDSTGPGDLLTVLALANLVLRLPSEVVFRVPDVERRSQEPPFRGASLREALGHVASELGRKSIFEKPPQRGGPSLTLESPNELWEGFVRSVGWTAHIDRQPIPESPQPFNPLSIYASACMASAELVRAWARETALLGAVPARRFDWDTASTQPTVINLWLPGNGERGPSLEGLSLPFMDWAGAGAVTQSALAVLGAVPGLTVRGRIYDPKELDAPDLNRSILSFLNDIGQAKAAVSAKRALGELEANQVAYPDGTTASWVICGADEVSVRATCQKLWPDRLLVVSTEGSFARVTAHAPDWDTFCAGCPGVADLGSDPIPTIAPTSVFAGVLAAAAIVRLSLGGSVRCIDALTLRLDAMSSVHATSPRRRESCTICKVRSRAP